jgi:hypothetical protein
MLRGSCHDPNTRMRNRARRREIEPALIYEIMHVVAEVRANIAAESRCMVAAASWGDLVRFKPGRQYPPL